jgi:hypothetical protein
MNKNANSKNLKVTAFWSLIGLFTISFVIVVIVMFVNLRPINSYSDINRDNLALVGNEMFTRNEQEYYVYVYSSKDNANIDSVKADELNQGIFNYFNFVKHNSKSDNVMKIYGLDANRGVVSNLNNYAGVSSFDKLKLNENELPVLLRVLDGGIDNAKFGTNEVLQELQLAMDKVE